MSPPRRRVRCRLCGKVLTLNNWTGHARTWHPEIAGKPRAQYVAELHEEPTPPPVPVPVVSRALALPEAPRVHIPPLGLDDLDDVVVAVVQQLSEPSGLLPVELLSAVFAWRSATASFLASVEQHRAGRDTHG